MSQTLKITAIKKCVTRCWLHLNHCLNCSHYFHFHSESIWRTYDVSPLGTEKIYIILFRSLQEHLNRKCENCSALLNDYVFEKRKHIYVQTSTFYSQYSLRTSLQI